MSDLDLATRELFVRGEVNECYFKTPFVEELQRRKQITYRAGKYIERLQDTEASDDMWQDYSTNEALRDEKKETLEKPRFTWKKGAYPMRYDIDEQTQNIGGPGEITLLDLASFLVKKAHKDQRRYLCRKIFNDGSTTPVADGAKGFQSLVSALNHDSTYGTKSRSFSSGTNDWWQGADPAGLNENVTSSSQDTAYNLTIANFRKWVNETDIAHYMESNEDLQVLLCPTLMNKIKGEAESRVLYKPGLKQKQGITSCYIDDIEFVSVPYLQRSSTTRTWLFILNLNEWELRIHTKRKWKMTPFKWQGENANGYDYWLARMLVIGNLVCWKPRSSMWLTAVS